jgi:hypothetical protein
MSVPKKWKDRVVAVTVSDWEAVGAKLVRNFDGCAKKNGRASCWKLTRRFDSERN